MPRGTGGRGSGAFSPRSARRVSRALRRRARLLRRAGRVPSVRRDRVGFRRAGRAEPRSVHEADREVDAAPRRRVTSNNTYMAERIVALGARRDRVEVVTLGADAFFGEQWSNSVNVRGREDGGAGYPQHARARAAVQHRRHHRRLRPVLRERPEARLVVAHRGSLTEELRARAARLGEASSSRARCHESGCAS